MSNNDWEHAYDDEGEIKEHQGYLPMWFKILFFGPIIFGAIYAVYIHYIDEWSQAKQFSEEVAEFSKLHPKVFVALKEDGTNPYRGDAAAIEAGQKQYAAICSACHGMNAEGTLGPSLIDNKWLHGSTDKKVYDVVMEGVLDVKKLKHNKGKAGPMPAHKTSLGPKKVLQVLAWLASKNDKLKAK